VVNYYHKDSYRVIKLPDSNPLDGFSVIKDAADKNASPYGWNNDGIYQYNVTNGNNVDVAVRNAESVYRAEASGNMIFESNWDAEKEPDFLSNMEASTTHLFYICNMMHDISYQVISNNDSLDLQKLRETSKPIISTKEV
jgi:extracellular elastinolytic metalloproteinase